MTRLGLLILACGWVPLLLYVAFGPNDGTVPILAVAAFMATGTSVTMWIMNLLRSIFFSDDDAVGPDRVANH